jgi:hypothetical protein
VNAVVLIENRYDAAPIMEQHSAFLPSDWKRIIYDLLSIRTLLEYNQLLTKPSFWEQLSDYNRVLIIQHDSQLLRPGIEEFLQWDYVGAPWRERSPWARTDRAGGNGGLSLRNPILCRELCWVYPYNPSMGNEDVYFTHNLEMVEGKVAPYEVCKKFSVETEFALGTLGHHAAHLHLTKDQFRQIEQQYAKQPETV